MDVNYAESTDTTYFVESNVLLVDKKKLSVVVQCVLRETELGKCEENALNDTVLKMLHWIKKLSALYELKKENIKSEVGYQDIKETKVLILRLAILLP